MTLFTEEDRILLLSPHTDDVELAMGGTLARILEEGFPRENITWLVFSACEDSLPIGKKIMLREEFILVTDALGIRQHRVGDYPVRRLHEHRQEILEELIEVRDEFKPTVVFCPSEDDKHQDHQVVTQETIRAFLNHASILAYFIHKNIRFPKKDWYVRLSLQQVEQQWLVLRLYKSQFQQSRRYFSREAIVSRARNAALEITRCDYAEVFELIRWIH